MNFLGLLLLLIFSLELPSSLCNAVDVDVEDNIHKFQALEWEVVSPKGDPCITELGFFGRSAKFERPVTYQYELTLIGGAYLSDAYVPPGEKDRPPNADGLQGVFNAIETAIADALLESEVFEAVCKRGEVIGPYRKIPGRDGRGGVGGRGGNRQLRTTTSSSGERKMRAVGISSNPEDQILEGLTCRAFVNATDGPCLVVDGEFKIYMDIFEDLDGSLSQFLFELMNEKHQLDGVHPYIQKVRYIDLSADLISDQIQDETIQSDQKGTNQGFSSSVYALIAAGSFVVVGTAIFYRRRRNAADHDGETTTMDQRTAQLQSHS